MVEHWKVIPGVENYEASTLGRIRNKKTQQIRMTHINNGYEKCRMRINGKSKDMKVHRLIAFTWIPNPDSKLQVDHVDENKLNNCIDNLEWVSPSENMKRRYANNKNSLKPKPLKVENDDEILYFTSSCECARHFECSSATVWGATINQRRWRGYTIRVISKEEYQQAVAE